jgi:sterol desaturase/sphingolipid hydroxylase (fatty acid hydroxylase superfamily)
MQDQFSTFHQFFTFRVLVTQTIFWVIGGVFALLDLRYSLAINIKLQDVELPTPQAYRTLAWVVLTRHVLTTVPVQAVTGILMVYLGYRDFSVPLPSMLEVVTHFAVFAICNEIFFYYTHRLMHTPLLYARFHKMHHEWKSPIAISSVYCTATDHIFSNILPLCIGPTLMCPHLAVVYLWEIVAIIHTLSVHSGYAIPSHGVEMHDTHHKDFRLNYGAMGWMDWLHGTAPTRPIKKAQRKPQKSN